MKLNQKTLLSVLVVAAVGVIAFTWYEEESKSSVERFSERFGRGFPFD